MRVWTMAGGSVAALGVVALVIGASAPVSGQQSSYVFKSGDGQDQRIIVRQRQGAPAAMARIIESVGRPRLGVSVRDVTADDVAKLKLPSAAGVLVDEVEKDTPAAKGGVLKGDVALVFDGENVRSVSQFTRLVRESAPGRVCKLTVLRDGKRTDLTVTPEVAADDMATVFNGPEGGQGQVWQFRTPSPGGPPQGVPHGQMAPMPPVPPMPPMPRRYGVMPGPGGQFQWNGQPGGAFTFQFENERGRLGVQVQDLSADLADFFGVKSGALVSTVQKDTPAAKAGVKAGDVITAVDGKAVSNAAELVEQVREKSGDVTLTVMRDKKALTLKATLEKAETPKPKVAMPGRPS